MIDNKLFFVIAGIIILFYLTTQVESFYPYYRGYPGYNPYYRGWCPWWNPRCRRRLGGRGWGGRRWGRRRWW